MTPISSEISTVYHRHSIVFLSHGWIANIEKDRAALNFYFGKQLTKAQCLVKMIIYF